MNIKPNILIHSDTLMALERIPSEYLDLVYLDPPWPSSSYQFSALLADDYYTYIFRVVQQAYRILKRSGNLFLYSNPDLNADFHLALREVFGNKNFESEFIIPRKFASLSSLGSRHETLILYKKSDKSFLNGKVRKLTKDEIAKNYPYKDEKGVFRSIGLLFLTEREGRKYQWKGYTPPKGYSWRYSKERMDSLESDGLILTSNSSTGLPRLKQYLTQENEFVSVGTVWNDLPASHTKSEYPGSQPIELFERILFLGSSPGDTILDTFCGSGNLLMAAINSDRKFIACDANSQAIELVRKKMLEIHENVPEVKEADLIKMPILWNEYKLYQFSDENILTDLIMKGESASVEFKESAKWNHFLNKPDENTTASVLRAIAAFLNSGTGGTILIGVKDDKTLIGLEKDFECVDKRRKNEDGYSLFISSKIRSSFGPLVIGKYSIRFYNINLKDICRIDVLPSNNPFFLEGKFIIRNNNESSELSTEEFYERLKTDFVRFKEF